MVNAMEIEKAIKTESGLDEFQVRLVKIDGVGLLTDHNEKSYLILDSLDYWYDLIQDAYPAKIKCSCKNDWFKVTFCYKYCEDSADIREVLVSTVCSRCGKNAQRMLVDIDYRPANELVDKPITYCEKPKIKYKYSHLSALWSPSDWERVFQFLTEELDLTAYYYYRKDKTWIFKALSLKQTLEIDQFLFVYFTRNEPENAVKYENERGAVVDRDIWRKQELIRIATFNVNGFTMFEILFCNQYIDKGDIKDKTAEFEEVTTRLMTWLKENFTSERYRNCFDSEEIWRKFHSL